MIMSYDSFIFKWMDAPEGTIKQKMDWINAQTVTNAASPMREPYSEAYNRLDRAQYTSLITINQRLVAKVLPPTEVVTPPIRAEEQNPEMLGTSPAGIEIAPAGPVYANLQPYVATLDAAQIPWATATVAQGGGGLGNMVTNDHLKAYGIIST